ncbi:hypothetical protein NDU88_002491 [Pleurodeles waltl]|uniref:Uncharacterized protein n=1 Tax=Pleurodeles waltl TaxID=8319 RepID=A0AAV7MN97_PLEWA|nr:hypothetical protein NDU88_002491 [Pleurodeles waltl]
MFACAHGPTWCFSAAGRALEEDALSVLASPKVRLRSLSFLFAIACGPHQRLLFLARSPLQSSTTQDTARVAQGTDRIGRGRGTPPSSHGAPPLHTQLSAVP